MQNIHIKTACFLASTCEQIIIETQSNLPLKQIAGAAKCANTKGELRYGKPQLQRSIVSASPGWPQLVRQGKKTNRHFTGEVANGPLRPASSPIFQGHSTDSAARHLRKVPYSGQNYRDFTGYCFLRLLLWRDSNSDQGLLYPRFQSSALTVKPATLFFCCG